MHHRVEYFTSADGAHIAGARAGSGAPLFVVPSMVDAIEATLSRFTEAFPDREIVTYDRRGSGLSERDAGGDPPELFVADAQVVLDRCGLERTAVLGTLLGAVEAAVLAASNAERVTQLVLRAPVISVGEWATIAEVRAARAAMEEDWVFFTEAFNQFVVGWGNPGGPETAARMRDVTTGDELRTMLDALARLDLPSFYARIAAPVLLEHHRDYFFNYAHEVASLIPNCRLEMYAGARSDFVHDFSIARDFLAEGTVDVGPTGFQTILFTDLEESTPLTQRLGDEGAQELLERHDVVVRAALASHHGREVKHTGDGIMARFGSAVGAVDAALEMRDGLAGEGIRARIGLNAGEPVVRDGDLFGAVVQLAARIGDAAAAGQVLVSNVVRELCAGKRFTFRAVGPTQLRGFEHPVDLFEVVETA